MNPAFEIRSGITDISTIAVDRSIREIDRLEETYGKGRWKKMKGVALIRLPDGFIGRAEIHWYECHGIGKKEYKIKQYLS